MEEFLTRVFAIALGIVAAGVIEYILRLPRP